MHFIKTLAHSLDVHARIGAGTMLLRGNPAAGDSHDAWAALHPARQGDGDTPVRLQLRAEFGSRMRALRTSSDVALVLVEAAVLYCHVQLRAAADMPASTPVKDVAGPSAWLIVGALLEHVHGAEHIFERLYTRQLQERLTKLSYVPTQPAAASAAAATAAALDKEDAVLAMLSSLSRSAASALVVDWADRPAALQRVAWSDRTFVGLWSMLKAARSSAQLSLTFAQYVQQAADSALLRGSTARQLGASLTVAAAGVGLGVLLGESSAWPRLWTTTAVLPEPLQR